MDKPGLITGCGPIGMLAILVARQAGVLEVLVTDITPKHSTFWRVTSNSSSMVIG
jgi:threonine dehydrogenase-like Zn-dependent dehydrogenase